MNMGTNTLARMDHLVEAEPISRFKKQHIRTNRTRIIQMGRPEASRALAPLIAITSPRLDQSKYFRNWAMK